MATFAPEHPSGVVLMEAAVGTEKSQDVTGAVVGTVAALPVVVSLPDITTYTTTNAIAASNPPSKSRNFPPRVFMA